MALLESKGLSTWKIDFTVVFIRGGGTLTLVLYTKTNLYLNYKQL